VVAVGFGGDGRDIEILRGVLHGETQEGERPAGDHSPTILHDEDQMRMGGVVEADETFQRESGNTSREWFILAILDKSGVAQLCR